MASKLISGGLFAIAFLGCLVNAQLDTNQTAQNIHDPQPQTPATQSQNTQSKSHPDTQNRRSSCVVEQQNKIQCGAPGTSATVCNALNCCFDGTMCYYGKYVTLHCTKDAQMIVIVSKDATIPNLDLESVGLLSKTGNCSPVATTSAFAIYQFPVTECGTVMSEEDGVLTYENRMFSQYEVELGPRGAITRDSFFDLSIQCRYTGSTAEALLLEMNILPSPYPAVGFGILNVELRLANGQCHLKGCAEDVAYSSYYRDSEYPITKELQDNVYVEVRMLGRTDPNLVLTLGHCWATSKSNPLSRPQWDLLINGCPYREDRYQTKLLNVGSKLMFPSHYRRFAFQMFTFVSTGAADPSKGNQVTQTVYIHCNVAVCQPSTQYNCEPRCFRKKNVSAKHTLLSNMSI
uniref:Zona pellucida sperm-binding protein 4 n=1 Tax=Sphaeramia orbicularis TaxID=375764 RepID=A0A673AI16_9TELE